MLLAYKTNVNVLLSQVSSGHLCPLLDISCSNKWLLLFLLIINSHKFSGYRVFIKLLTLVINSTICLGCFITCRNIKQSLRNIYPMTSFRSVGIIHFTGNIKSLIKCENIGNLMMII